MKSNDRILRYLSGMMPPDEVISFEHELKESSTLKSEYMKIREQLENLKPDLQETESNNYFVNLLPKVRLRVEHRKTSVYSYLKYLAPVMAAIIIYLIIPFRSNSQIEEQIKDLNDSSQTELLNLIDESGSIDYSNEAIEIALSEPLTSDEIDQIDAKYFYTSDILENLSDEEINDIYNSILNKEIL